MVSSEKKTGEKLIFVNMEHQLDSATFRVAKVGAIMSLYPLNVRDLRSNQTAVAST